MFKELIDINKRPECFSIYTAEELWTEPHTAEQMLKYHLDKELPLASRDHKFIDRSVNWIVKRFGLCNGKKIADFGCGPGLYSSRLARAGAKLTGIDFSANSLAYAEDTARREGLDIDYQQMNYLNFNSNDRYDLIVMIMCDFCALNPAQRAQLLGVFKEHLAPDGRVLLDVYTLAGFSGREESSSYERRQLNGFWSSGDYFGFVTTFKYEDEMVVLDKYTIIEEDRTRTVYNWLQYFDLDTLKKECEKSGLTVEEVHRDVAGSTYCSDADEMSVVLRKN